MRIDPQLFRAKSLKIKIDGLLSDLLEFYQRNIKDMMQNAYELLFDAIGAICVKSIGFSQPVPQIFFKKNLKLLTPMKGIDSDSSLLVLSRDRFPSVEATIQGPDEKYWLLEYKQIDAQVENF